DALDFVPVGAADEGPVVARVVLRPQPRRVERLRAELGRRGMEGADVVGVGSLERYVYLAVRAHVVEPADPERRLAVAAVADGDIEVQLPGVPERAEGLV